MVLVRVIARTSFGQAALIVVVLFRCRIFVAGGFRRELAWWLSVSGQHLWHEVGATQRHVAGMFVAFRVFQECVKDHADAANKSDPPVYELSFEEERYQKGEGKIEEQGSGRSVLVFFESADRELVCPVVELFYFYRDGGLGKVKQWRFDLFDLTADVECRMDWYVVYLAALAIEQSAALRPV